MLRIVTKMAGMTTMRRIDLETAADPSAYWRRRFFILGGGVAVLGLCAWLFPGGHSAPPRASATAQASMAALARQGTLPAAAYGSAWPGVTPKKTATPSGATRSTAAAKPHGKASASAHPDGSPSPGRTATASRAPALRAV